MGYTCIVPNCKTGYNSEKNKQTQSFCLFRIPQQDERLRQWERNIPRDIKLKSTHRVCEKHFTSDCIVRKTIVNYNDPAIPNLEVLLAKPHLTKTAVPTIFPNCPAYLNKTVIPRKKPAVRKSFIKIKKVQTKIIEESDLVGNEDEAFENNEILQSENDRDLIPKNDTEHSVTRMNPNSLMNELLLLNFENLPKSWGCHKLRNKDVSCIVLSKIMLISNNTVPVIEKQIWFDASLQYRCAIFSKPVNLNDFLTVDLITSILDIYNLINIIDSMPVCLGTLKNDSVVNVSGFIDLTGNWRSEQCTFLLKAGRKTCSFCKLLSRTITTKI